MLSSVVALSKDIVVIVVKKYLHKPVFQTLNPGIQS